MTQWRARQSQGLTLSEQISGCSIKSVVRDVCNIDFEVEDFGRPENPDRMIEWNHTDECCQQLKIWSRLQWKSRRLKLEISWKSVAKTFLMDMTGIMWQDGIVRLKCEHIIIIVVFPFFWGGANNPGAGMIEWLVKTITQRQTCSLLGLVKAFMLQENICMKNILHSLKFT